MHVPVLLQSSIDGLAIEKNDIVVDATFGEGGHSREILNRFGQNVRIIGIDLDSAKVAQANNFAPNVRPVEGNFRDIDTILDSIGVEKVNRILVDLGFGSHTLESGRGFSFQKDEPLIMTYTEKISPETMTARDVVNSWEEENLKTIIKSYGDEKYSGRIARAIVESRKEKEIETTKELADIISHAVPIWYRHGRIHPATRTFQAIRIAVNDELGAIQDVLSKGFERLAENGRIAIISFHSLEDRIVKHFFKEKDTAGQGKIITKKPITASIDEITQNPRSRSAKLRILEKIQ